MISLSIRLEIITFPADGCAGQQWCNWGFTRLLDGRTTSTIEQALTGEWRTTSRNVWRCWAIDIGDSNIRTDRV